MKLNNLIFLTTIFSRLKKERLIFQFIFFLFCKPAFSQPIANYINNGSFEDCVNCNQSFQLLVARYWSGIDTNKFFGFNLSALPPTGQVPNSGFTHQWPKSGNNYFLSTLLFINSPTLTARGYPRNRLKGNLQTGKTYCVKIYYNITNQSSYGIDGLGAYFGDNSLDTITQCDKAITYLIPQIQNPTNNLLTDTLNWNLLTGTFTANGTEKYMLLGNFKSDIATNSVMINPANLPTKATDFLFDDVSVIDIDLPAYAGPDIWGIPTNTVYLGRPQDVGIDEACMWYKLPNTTTAIDTAAGIIITVAATTETYMVKQTICGNIKYDTVVVHASGLGFASSSGVENSVKIYPNPANEILTVELVTLSGVEVNNTKIQIINSLGQIIREEEIVFKNKIFKIKVNDLLNGVYILKLSSILFDSAQSDNLLSISKRFVIAR